MNDIDRDDDLIERIRDAFGRQAIPPLPADLMQPTELEKSNVDTPDFASALADSRGGNEWFSRLAATGTVAIAVSLLVVALIRMKPDNRDSIFSDSQDGDTEIADGDSSQIVENPSGLQAESPQLATAPVDQPPAESPPFESPPDVTTGERPNRSERASERASDRGSEPVDNVAAAQQEAGQGITAPEDIDDALEEFGFLTGPHQVRPKRENTFAGFDSYVAMQSLAEVLQGSGSFSKQQFAAWANLLGNPEDTHVERTRHVIGKIAGLQFHARGKPLPRRIGFDHKTQQAYALSYLADELLDDTRRIVDHILGDVIFDDLLDGIKNDPDGPELDVREFLQRRLSGDFWVVVDKTAGESEPQMLFVFSVRDQTQFVEDMLLALSKEPTSIRIKHEDEKTTVYSVEKMMMYWTDGIWVVGASDIVRRSLAK